MRVEIDLEAIKTWALDHGPLAPMIFLVVWYLFFAQVVRVAYHARPHWFGDPRVFSEPVRRDRAIAWHICSPLVPFWLVAKTTL